LQLLGGTAPRLLVGLQEAAFDAAVSSGRGAWHPCICTVLSEGSWDNTLQSFLGNCEHLGETRSLLNFFSFLLFPLGSLLLLFPLSSPLFPFSSSELCALRTSCLNIPPAAPAWTVTKKRSSPAVRSSGATLFARGGLPRCNKKAKVYLEAQTVNNSFYKPAQAF